MNINQLVKETFEMQKQAKVLDEQIKINRAAIQKHFENDKKLMKSNTLIVDNVKVTKIDSAYITYNGIKIEESLKKAGKSKLLHKVINKSYTIINIKAFTNLIKLTGISPFELSSHLKIDRKVDGNAVKSLFEKGDITKDDLDDCFTSNIVSSIRFNEITSEGD